MTADDTTNGQQESIADGDEIIEAGDGAEILTDGGVVNQSREETDRLLERADAVQEAVSDLVFALENNDLEGKHINDVRREIETLQVIVEREFAEETPGVEPWEKAVRSVPFGRLAEALGVELSDVNKLLREQEGD